ncbi:MAG: BrnT family toxin [Acidobacteriota bacterium]
MMDFEFDSAKSAANLAKHGIDFIGAQALWSDPDRLEIPARSRDEPRTQVIGRIGDLVWSAFITLRGDRIRIISVRRARDEEEAAYLPPYLQG